MDVGAGVGVNNLADLEIPRPAIFAILVALAIALLVGILATVLGALLHSEAAFADCAAGPCMYYHERGWPLPWITNAPGSFLTNLENPDYVFRYGSNGIAELAIFATVLMWFAVVVAGEGFGWVG
jgi:hypothetical protein